MQLKDVLDGKRSMRWHSIFLGYCVGVFIALQPPWDTHLVAQVYMPFGAILTMEYWFRLVEWVLCKIGTKVF